MLKNKWMLNMNRMGNGNQVDSEKWETIPVNQAGECSSDGNYEHYLKAEPLGLAYNLEYEKIREPWFCHFFLA